MSEILWYACAVVRYTVCHNGIMQHCALCKHQNTMYMWYEYHNMHINFVIQSYNQFCLTTISVGICEALQSEI